MKLGFQFMVTDVVEYVKVSCQTDEQIEGCRRKVVDGRQYRTGCDDDGDDADDRSEHSAYVGPNDDRVRILHGHVGHWSVETILIDAVEDVDDHHTGHG